MPAVRPGVTRRRHHRLGHRPAATRSLTNARPRGRCSTRPTSGSSSAPASASATSAAPPPACRSRPAGRRSSMAGARPGDDRRPGPRHHHARPHVPATSADGAARARPALRRLRPQRRLLRLRLRASSSAHGLIAIGRRAGARHRHRHAVPHHRLGRPQHRHPVRRRLRRRRARGGRRPGPAARLGPRRRRLAPSASSTPRSAASIQMDGKEVFRRAVRIMVDSAEKSMDARRRRRADDIALVVPHQANIRIIEAACDRLGIAMERAAVVLDRTGNTSSASIPLALADALDDGRVARRRPRAARRLRRRHDRGQRGHRAGAADGRERRRRPAGSSSSPAARGASASPAPAASPPPATGSPSPTAARPSRPTGCSP